MNKNSEGYMLILGDGERNNPGKAHFFATGAEMARYWHDNGRLPKDSMNKMIKRSEEKDV